MLTNFLKIAWRNLWRNKNYSIVNIIGLGIGLASVMLIVTYVQDEISYDRFYPDGDRIYRMSLERKYPGRSREYAIIPQSYASSVKADLAGIEDACRLFYFQGNNMLYRVNDQPYEEQHNMWADSNFFDFFGFTLLDGDIKTALTKPNSVVLTASTAKKLFGNNSAIGQRLEFPQPQNSLTVTGVCPDIPENSHLKFNTLTSATSLGQFLSTPNYLNFSAYTYLKLVPGTDAVDIEKQFPGLVSKYASGPVLTQFGVDYAEYQKQGNGYRYFLQHLPNIYLDSNLEGEIKPPGSRSRIYFFVAIAALILIIACINFMNLATARSAGRAREVGIRKTLGSDRSQIAKQFLLEAIIISLFSGAIAWSIAALVLPGFNTLTGKSFLLSKLWQFEFLFILFGLSIIAGLLAGSYPAFALSGFKPVDVLQGKIMQRTKGAGLRNALVVFQFGISVFLIICSILVYQQWMFTQNKDLGFSKESLINLQGAGGMTFQEGETFKKEVAKIPGVQAVSGCNNQPGEQYFGMSFKPQGATEMNTGSGLIVDEGYIECMQMEMVAGRSFSKDFMDTLSVVINEAAVREMQLDEPVGKKLVSNDGFLNSIEGQNDVYTVIGVVKDFHFQSLHHVISPLFLVHNQKSFNPGVDNQVTVRVSNQNVTGALERMGKLWAELQPEVPFRYAFLDQEWASLYEKEITTRRIFQIFTALAIFIACLGLLALAAFTAERRIKEIGIRKILGATVPGIVRLLSLDFLKLVLISILIASPLAWYVMNNWLENFAYRINIGIEVFILSAFLALVIAFLTVSFQSMRAALNNPMQALRSD
ncbi:MAG: FtsX-like permease family protein [Saprospiraceae bacterium]|nr:FtsX-like permease family protein [Saprospiraceae bacterium]